MLDLLSMAFCKSQKMLHFVYPHTSPFRALSLFATGSCLHLVQAAVATVALWWLSSFVKGSCLDVVQTAVVVVVDEGARWSAAAAGLKSLAKGMGLNS